MALYGRERERERLESLIGTVRDGGSGALLVIGEPGAGKSALLDLAATTAADLRILRATAVETEHELPFGLLHQLINPELERRQELPEPQRRALDACFGFDPRAPAPDRLLVSLATLTLLATIAESTPVLCLIDDLQWADPESAAVVGFVARRLGSEGIGLLVASRRGGEAGAQRPRAADPLSSDPALPVLELGALDPSAAEQLLAGGRRRPVAAPVLERIISGTAGNALAIAELRDELSDRQLDGGEPLPDPLPVGSGVERAYAERIATLPDPCRTALLVAAAQGGGELHTALRAAAALGVDEGAFDELERRGLIGTAGGRIIFRHPLLRSAAYATAPGGDRRAAHEALAEAMTNDPERRVWQLASASVGPDQRLGAELESLGRGAAARGATATAAAALERSAELSVEPRERAARLAEAAGHAWTAGESRNALRLINAARDHRPPTELEGELNRLQGRIEAWGREPATGVRALCREAGRIADDRPELAFELLAEAAEVASFTADPALAATVGETAEVLPEPTGDPAALLLHRLLAGTNRLAAGRFAEAAPLLGEAVALGRNSDDPVTLNLAGRAAVYLGDEATSYALESRAADLAREAGALFTLPSIVVRIAITELRMGRLRQAETSAREAAALADLAGQDDLVACAFAALAQVLAERGAAEGSRAAAGRALEIADARGLGLFAEMARGALAHLELVSGNHEAALALLGATEHPAIAQPAALDHVEAAVGAGEPKLAEAVAESAAQWADAGGVPIARAVALACAAAVAPPERGIELLGEALEVHETIDRPFEHARAELQLGQLLRRQRQRVAAREHLRAALTAFEATGAEPWAERARAELRASGQTARRRDPSTIDDLTPQELRIGGLVAAGLTNKEIAARLILSPRTIDFHLRNLFRKLGVKSRTELARFETLRQRAD